MDIELKKYITAIVILLITFVIASLFNKVFKKWIISFTDTLKNDPLNYLFFRKISVAIIYSIGTSIAIYTIPSLKHMASSLLAGAGIFAVAIGLASQQAFSNIISGLFLVIFKPFKINDRIEVSSYQGVVEDITLRHTVIRNYQNQRVVVPNAVISNDFIVNSNYDDDKICKLVDFGIDYTSNVKKAKQIIKEEVEKHPLNIDGRTAQEKTNNEERTHVRLISLDDSSVTLRVWAWSDTPRNGYFMACDLRESIKFRFEAEGIDIPFPHRTIVYKTTKDES